MTTSLENRASLRCGMIRSRHAARSVVPMSGARAGQGRTPAGLAERCFGALQKGIAAIGLMMAVLLIGTLPAFAAAFDGDPLGPSLIYPESVLTERSSDDAGCDHLCSSCADVRLCMGFIAGLDAPKPVLSVSWQALPWVSFDRSGLVLTPEPGPPRS